VEEIVATNPGKRKSSKPKIVKNVSPRLKEIGDALGNKLDTRVSVELGQQKGKITIEFANVEDLERISKLI
jgi:ParB family chromosome partitioning protein